MSGPRRSRLFDSLVRLRWILPFVALTPFFVLVAAGDMSDGSAESAETGWVPILLAVWFFILVVLAVTVLMLNLSGHDPDAEDAAAELVADPLGRMLLARWLQRSRHHRFVGGLVGFILGVGLIRNGNSVPALIGLMAGIALGGALAEIHLVRGDQTSTRLAELRVRRVAEYVPLVDRLALAAVAVGAAAVVVLAQIIGQSGPTSTWVAAALVVVATVLGMQRLVVQRRRPALNPALAQADDLLRSLAASQGFARPGIALSMILLAQAVVNLGTASATSNGVEQSTVAPVVQLALWLAGAFWYWMSRRERSRSLAVSFATQRQSTSA